MAGKRVIWKVLKVFLIILSLLLLLFAIFIFLSFYRDFTLVHSPDEKKNTIWECQECDLYCIVDKNGYSYGAINQNGKTVYVDVYWDQWGAFSIHRVDPVRNQHMLPETNWAETLVEHSDYTCRRGVATANIMPESFHLWETGEPVTLTFVCQGKIPETDIYNGIDPIRRMEVLD